MGSKMIGFRCPDDLAEEFAQYCGGAGKTTGEVLRKLVDDLIYPGSGRDRSRLYARGETATLDDLERLYGVSATEKIVELVNDQIKEQLNSQLGHMVKEKLELVQVDRGLSAVEKEQLVSKMDLLTQRIDKIVEQDNRNIQLENENFREWGDKVYLLFLALDKHSHSTLTGNAMMASEAAKLINAEVILAEKHRGKLPAVGAEKEPAIIQGKTSKPGYRYHEFLNVSVKE